MKPVMRRFLIVGCGGSGGATIRFIQDQLLADLKPEGTAKLPAAWQFVHIDVPTTPDSGPAPLGSVRDMGGRYLSVSNSGNTYDRTANQILQGVKNRLDTTLGWVPDPSKCSVPVTEGAGQFRAVGRALTLTHVSEIQSVLQQAFVDLQQPDPWQGLSATRRTGVADGGEIIPIVIGSMAGGSGASMFLDVCRLLARIPGIDPLSLGAFLFTADVFKALPQDARLGVEGNAMGAIGDIVAAQTGLSYKADKDIFAALGLPDIPEFAFARVFPIGSAIGGDGAVFGDGTPMGIFRGIGRALAALMLSDVQSNYIAHIVGNPSPTTTEIDDFGWGTQAETLAWGSFGYASLSLGRDRYMEYSAQRLARAAAERLMAGHMDSNSDLPSSEQLKREIDSQWGPTLTRLGLPQPGEDIGSWFRNVAFGSDFAVQESKRVVTDVVSMISSTPSAAAMDWFNQVVSRLPQFKEPVRDGLGASAYAWNERFAGDFESRVIEEFLESTMRRGLPYGREVLNRLQAEIEVIVNNLQQAPDPNALEPLAVDSSISQRVQAMKKAVVAAGHELVDLVTKSITTSSSRVLVAAAAKYAASVLDSFKSDVLTPLINSASLVLQDLEASRDSSSLDAGLAQLRSEIVREWPEDSADVPARFAHAENEVLLTVASEFPALFESHVVATAGGNRPYKDALSIMIGDIIRGKWETQGGMLGEIEIAHTKSTWRAAVLNIDSERGTPTPRSMGSYSFDFAPAQVLERARLFLERPNEPFSDFRRETIGAYLNDPRMPVPVLEERKHSFVRKFIEAMRLARPLVGVSAAMIQAVHPSSSISYTYQFSQIGLKTADEAVERIKASIEADNEMDPSVLSNFLNATGDDATETKIAIFGGYPKYSPIVFSSLLDTVQDRFATIPETGRADLWRWKSTRPLQASLPMSPAEMKALIGGWFLGRLTGRVRTGQATQPVVVWDDEYNRWIAMPWPMLTSPATAPEIDWLPLILEAYSLALVQCNRDTSLSALRPYRALRQIWDSSKHAPGGRGLMGGFAAENHVRDWLKSGRVSGADPSAIVADAEMLAVEERRAQARQWIEGVKSWLASSVLTEGRGVDFGRKIGRIDSISELFTKPMFVAVAPIVDEMLSELDSILQNVQVVTESSSEQNPLSGNGSGNYPVM